MPLKRPHRCDDARNALCGLSAGAIALFLAPGAALADAASENTLSLRLQLSAPQDNLFGYAYKSAGARSVTSNPGAPGGPTLDVVAPQDVISASPNKSREKQTAATFQINLANLSGSGGGAKPAQDFNPGFTGSFVYRLNDALVDNLAFDHAASSWTVIVTLNDAVLYSNTLAAADPQDLTDTVTLPLGGIVLPAHSLSKLVIKLGLSAAVSSYRPPAPPEPPLIPPPPDYPAVPEPTSWALMILGLGLAGGATRRARISQIPASA